MAGGLEEQDEEDDRPKATGAALDFLTPQTAGPIWSTTICAGTGDNRREYYCSRELLSLVSPVLEGILATDSHFLESRQTVIPFPEDEAMWWRELLNYIHPHTPAKLSVFNVRELAILAHKYMIEQVLRDCEDYLCSRDAGGWDLSLVEKLHFVDCYDVARLRRICHRELASPYAIQVVMMSPEWQELSSGFRNEILEYAFDSIVFEKEEDEEEEEDSRPDSQADKEQPDSADGLPSLPLGVDVADVSSPDTMRRLKTSPGWSTLPVALRNEILERAFSTIDFASNGRWHMRHEEDGGDRRRSSSPLGEPTRTPPQSLSFATQTSRDCGGPSTLEIRLGTEDNGRHRRSLYFSCEFAKLLSPVWARTIEQSPDAAILSLPNESASDFVLLLNHLHPRVVAPITVDTVLLFLQYAHDYSIVGLSDECEDFLLDSSNAAIVSFEVKMAQIVGRFPYLRRLKIAA